MYTSDQCQHTVVMRNEFMHQDTKANVYKISGMFNLFSPNVFVYSGMVNLIMDIKV